MQGDVYEVLIFGFIKIKPFRVVCFIFVMILLVFAFHLVWGGPGGPFNGFMSQVGVVLLGFAVSQLYKLYTHVVPRPRHWASSSLRGLRTRALY